MDLFLSLLLKLGQVQDTKFLHPEFHPLDWDF